MMKTLTIHVLYEILTNIGIKTLHDKQRDSLDGKISFNEATSVVIITWQMIIKSPGTPSRIAYAGAVMGVTRGPRL